MLLNECMNEPITLVIKLPCLGITKHHWALCSRTNAGKHIPTGSKQFVTVWGLDHAVLPPIEDGPWLLLSVPSRPLHILFILGSNLSPMSNLSLTFVFLKIHTYSRNKPLHKPTLPPSAYRNNNTISTYHFWAFKWQTLSWVLYRHLLH